MTNGENGKVVERKVGRVLRKVWVGCVFFG